MINLNTFYTSQNLWEITPESPIFFIKRITQPESGSSVNEFFSIPAYTAPLTWWRYERVIQRDVVPESVRENFIGMLSAEETEKMHNELISFRKRFDEDLNKRNKILFGE